MLSPTIQGQGEHLSGFEPSESAIKVYVSVSDDWAKKPRQNRRLVHDFVEIAVVADGRHGVTDGRVNGPIGLCRDLNGHLDGFEEQ